MVCKRFNIHDFIDGNKEATRTSWQHTLDLVVLLGLRAKPNRFYMF